MLQASEKETVRLHYGDYIPSIEYVRYVNLSVITHSFTPPISLPHTPPLSLSVTLFPVRLKRRFVRSIGKCNLATCPKLILAANKNNNKTQVTSMTISGQFAQSQYSTCIYSIIYLYVYTTVYIGIPVRISQRGCIK